MKNLKKMKACPLVKASISSIGLGTTVTELMDPFRMWVNAIVGLILSNAPITI